MMRVMVTGASGFVGSALTARLVQSGLSVVAVGRRRRKNCPAHTYIEADLTRACTFFHESPKVDCIVHLAGRAHILGSLNQGQLDSYREVNRDAAVRLARAALIAGVKRFIFVSSIGVNGSFTKSSPFTEQSPAAPQTDYAISKWEAEVELQHLLSDTSMELVIIRPPLIYAADAPGNFGRLLRAVDSGMPLPLKRVVNLRSVISRDNFVNFLELCVRHCSAAGELFLVKESEPVSTPDIIRAISAGLGRVPRLFSFPPRYLEVALRRLGKTSMYEQLCGSLQVDDLKARTLLGWAPKCTTYEGLYRAGVEYRMFKNELNARNN